MAQAPYVSLSTFKSLMRITDTVDDDRIALALDHATDHINLRTGRRFDLQAGITRTVNGSGTRRLYVGDVTAVTAITMAPSTGGTPVVQAAGSWFLGPDVPDREDDEPYQYIDIVTPGTPGVSGFDWVNNPYPGYYGPVWYQAYRNVAVTGDFGWLEVPADIKTACLDIAQRYRESMAAGFSDVIGTTEQGLPIWSKALSPMSTQTLERRKLRAVVMA